MLEQERPSCDPARAARAEEFREGNEQIDRQEEQVAHELKIITPANLHKTDHSGDSRQNLPIRHPQPKSRGGVLIVANQPPNRLIAACISKRSFTMRRITLSLSRFRTCE